MQSLRRLTLNASTRGFFGSRRCAVAAPTLPLARSLSVGFAPPRSEGVETEALRATVANKPSTAVREMLSSKDANLFGHSWLNSPEHFVPLAQQSLRNVRELRRIMLALDEAIIGQNPSLALQLLDAISNELCLVIDFAELVRHIHHDKKFVQAAEDAFEIISEFINELNADRSVYDLIVSFKTREDLWSRLTVEERIFVDDMKQEYETNGVLLNPAQLGRSVELQNQLVQAESVFSQNINNIDETVALGPFASQDSNFYALKNWLSKYADQTYSGNPNHLICPLDRRISGSIMKSADNESVRRQLWYELHKSPADNMDQLGALIKQRQALATHLGYQSWVHKSLSSNRLVGNDPAKVIDVLKHISESTRAAAEQELQALRQLKGMLPQQTSAAVQSWDLMYLTHIYGETAAKQRRQQLQKPSVNLEEFFSVETCFEGLKQVTRQVFGLKMTVAPMNNPNERWLKRSFFGQGLSSLSSSSGRFGTEDIVKVVVEDEATGVVRGVVYIDLYIRNGKFPGSAHFNMQCGCKHIQIKGHDSKTTIPNHFLQYLQGVRTAAKAEVLVKDLAFEEFRQVPVIALVFNFSAANMSADRSTYLLSPMALETLYHEWGHALHSLLSETKYQHLSGTRGTVDYVEIPSHVMEYFARSPAVIGTWARHYQTEEPVDVAQLQLLNRNALPALDLQHQLLYSFADQYLFGNNIPGLDQLSDAEVYQRALNTTLELQKSFTCLPVEDLPNMNLLTHGHFINYGGGYYAYMIARIYAAHIWHDLFQQNPLNRESGRVFEKKMLRFGSSKHASDVLLDLLGGQQVNPNHFLQSMRDPYAPSS